MFNEFNNYLLRDRLIENKIDMVETSLLFKFENNYGASIFKLNDCDLYELSLFKQQGNIFGSYNLTSLGGVKDGLTIDQINDYLYKIKNKEFKDE